MNAGKVKFTTTDGMIKSLVTNGGAVAVNCIITILIIPFVAERLGTEAYGFVSLANNFVSFVAIMSLALNSYAVRYISVAYHKNEQKQTVAYYSSVIIGNLAFSFVIIVLGVLFASVCDIFLQIPGELKHDVKVLFVLTIINFGVQTVGNSFTVFAYINNRMEIIGCSSLLAYLSELVIFVVLFQVLSPRTWYVAIAYLSYSVVIFMMYMLMQKQYMYQIPFSAKSFSLPTVRELVVNGLWNSVNSLGNTLNTGLDLLITNMMLDAVTMGELAIAKTIGNFVQIIYNLVSQAFQPRFLKYYSEQAKEQLLKELKKSMWLSGFFVGIFFCIIAGLGEWFYQLWLPNQNAHMLYILTILTLLSYLLEGVVGPLYYVYTLAVKNKIPCLITLAGGIINVIAMYILLRYTSLGVYAVVGTTIVVMMVINLVTNPLYVARCLQVKWYTFYPTIIGYVAYVCIASFVLKWISGFFAVTGWKEFVCILMPEGVIGAGVYVLLRILERKFKACFIKSGGKS